MQTWTQEFQHIQQCSNIIYCYHIHVYLYTVGYCYLQEQIQTAIRNSLFHHVLQHIYQIFKAAEMPNSFNFY